MKVIDNGVSSNVKIDLVTTITHQVFLFLLIMIGVALLRGIPDVFNVPDHHRDVETN